jgi:hypothetical protein
MKLQYFTLLRRTMQLRPGSAARAASRVNIHQTAAKFLLLRGGRTPQIGGVIFDLAGRDRDR